MGSMLHLLASTAAVLAATAAAIVIVLHFVRSGVDPRVDGVSAYALGRFGPWYRLQVVVTGLAALSLTLVLLAAGLASGVGVALLAVFGASRILIARYPTDPRGTTALTRRGRLHVMLAATTFVTIALAAPSISPALVVSPAWHGLAMLLTASAWATAILALGTFVSASRPTTRRVFGLVERGAYASMLTWLIVAATGAGGLG
jgi:hypothetical protein